MESFLSSFLSNQFILFIDLNPFSHFSAFVAPRRGQLAAKYVSFQVATHPGINILPWAGEIPDSNLGLRDNSLACYQ